MRLFIRDHLALLFVYLLQLIIILLIFWLDGYQNLSNSLYAVFLSFCLFTGYLVYRYLTLRTFYQRLGQPLTETEIFSHNQAKALLSAGLQNLLENQYRQHQSHLQQSERKLKEHIHFINQWVHQMKTPVSVIHLLIQENDDPRYSAIGDELDRLKKGLDMVLYSARLEEFEHDFHVETLYLEKFIRSVTSSQKRLFIRNRVFPVIDIEPGLAIASDEKWLSFALTQILTNAVRYTTKVNSRIYIHASEQGANCVLEIRDEGVGIKRSDLPRVFDPYFTGENGRNFQESTGMGLFLVKEICDSLGHKVEIESVENYGTTVRFIF